jgi:hypothetical protein
MKKQMAMNDTGQRGETDEREYRSESAYQNKEEQRK